MPRKHTPLLPIICTFIVTLLLGCNSEGTSTQRQYHMLLKELDQAIAQKPACEAEKQQRIDRCRQLLADADNDMQRWDALNRLFLEYRSFALDSLYTTATRCQRIADRLDNDSLKWKSRLMLAEALKNIGEYKAAAEILLQLPPQARTQITPSFYNRMVSVYYSLYADAYTAADSLYFRDKLLQYRDSLIAYYPAGDPAHIINVAEKQLLLGNPHQALCSINVIKDKEPSPDFNVNIIRFIRAKAFLACGETDSAKLLLASTSIDDIRNNVRKYEALHELAKIISDEGDSERAYRYIMCAAEDIQSSNARARMHNVSRLLPMIAKAHNTTNARHRSTRRVMTVALCIMIIVLTLISLMLYRRHQTLSRERLQLQQRNATLSELKEQIDTVNRKLEESTKVKEEYIGYLFSLCSEYVNDMEKQRVQIKRQLTGGTIRDVEALLKVSHSDKYLKTFFEKFDLIFLDLFPDFIDKFNSLLKPECAIVPKPGERLTPELRIYALVRLGINDSVKIATFLHYSTQTVYNYRQRIRNNSIVEKGEFVKRVQEL